MKEISKSKEKKILKHISGMKHEMFREAEIQTAQVLLGSLEQLFLDVTDDLFDFQGQYKKKQISHIRMFIIEKQTENYSRIIKTWTDFIQEKIEEVKKSAEA